MKGVVTGGAGFVGSNLVRHLQHVSEVTEIVVIDALSFGFADNLDGLDLTFIEGSILDEAVLESAVTGASAIVHLAARSSVPRSVAHPIAAHEVNATGTVRVLEAARKVSDVHVIVASSSSVYGANEALPKHEKMVTRPVSPYAASKLATEAYTLAWGHSYAVPVLALRFFNIFGPLQPPLHAYAAAIPSLLAAAFTGQPLPVHGAGSRRDHYRCCPSAGESPRTGEPGLRHQREPSGRDRTHGGRDWSPTPDREPPAAGRRCPAIAGRLIGTPGPFPRCRAHSSQSRPHRDRAVVRAGTSLGPPFPRLIP